MPIDKFLEMEDVFMRNLWVVIANRVLEVKDKQLQVLARRIANDVWSAVKK